MKKFSSVFLQTFNLCHVWYYKLTDSGVLSFIGSFVDWTEIFANEKLYMTYVCHPKFFVPGIALRKDVQNPHIKEVCKSWEKKFGEHQTLVITNQIENGIEEFGFTSQYSHDMQTEIFLNEISMFKLFIRKFKEEYRLFNSVNDIEIDVSLLIGPEFHTDKIHHPKKIDKRALLKQFYGNSALSPRETEVMQWLLLGYSASQVGTKLCISKRTVEHHIERIKYRLDISSKAEMVQKARERELIGALQAECAAPY